MVIHRPPPDRNCFSRSPGTLLGASTLSKNFEKISGFGPSRSQANASARGRRNREPDGGAAWAFATLRNPAFFKRIAVILRSDRAVISPKFAREGWGPRGSRFRPDLEKMPRKKSRVGRSTCGSRQTRRRWSRRWHRTAQSRGVGGPFWHADSAPRTTTARAAVQTPMRWCERAAIPRNSSRSAPRSRPKRRTRSNAKRLRAGRRCTP